MAGRAGGGVGERKKMGVEESSATLDGDAFAVDYGNGYDIALTTNFLHHFDIPTCTTLLRKVAAAMKPGGSVGDPRVRSQRRSDLAALAAGFALDDAGGNARGDAYTLAQLRRMSEEAGFKSIAVHPMPTPQNLVTRRQRSTLTREDPPEDGVELGFAARCAAAERQPTWPSGRTSTAPARPTP